MAIGKEGNVKWVDGLRGLASSLVVMTHICRTFDEDLFFPASGENVGPRFLQLPFLRVIVQGRIGVAVFSFVTGYVCALKPIKLFRQGNQEAAWAAISKSALRRVPRLILPTIVMTLIVWVMCQLGLFLVAKHSDSWWAAWSAPDRMPSVSESILDLVHNLVSTWTWGRNAYDANQWTLLPLLKGSLWVYMFLIATSNVQPKYRLLACLGVYFYFFMALDPGFGMMFFWGVLLCEIQNMPSANEFISTRPKVSRCIAFGSLILGLYIASYPEGHWEWTSWSSGQHAVFDKILPMKPNLDIAIHPPEKASFPRFASSIGLQLITLGIHFSPLIKDFLSSKYLLWLGKQSFAVYLIHGPLLRWMLCWMVYGPWLPADITNEDGQVVPGKLVNPGGLRLLMCLPLWFPMNYGLAMLWTGYVDPWAASMTEKIVSYVKRTEEEKPVVLPQ